MGYGSNDLYIWKAATGEIEMSCMKFGPLIHDTISIENQSSASDQHGMCDKAFCPLSDRWRYMYNSPMLLEHNR